MEKNDFRAASSGPSRCPFCHDDIDPSAEGWIACGACLARHHSECWFEANACASCKNPSPLVPVERPPRGRGMSVDVVRRERRRFDARNKRWLLGVTLAALVIANVLLVALYLLVWRTAQVAPFIYNIF